MSRRLAFAFTILVVALGGATHDAFARDADYERLAATFDSLAADPRLGTLAPAQMDLARAALQAFKEGGRRDRPYLGYVAGRRIEIARATAEAELAERERVALQRDNDRLQLEAARRDAAQARRAERSAEQARAAGQAIARQQGQGQFGMRTVAHGAVLQTQLAQNDLRPMPVPGRRERGRHRFDGRAVFGVAGGMQGAAGQQIELDQPRAEQRSRVHHEAWPPADGSRRERGASCST